MVGFWFRASPLTAGLKEIGLTAIDFECEPALFERVVRIMPRPSIKHRPGMRLRASSSVRGRQAPDPGLFICLPSIVVARVGIGSDAKFDKRLIVYTERKPGCRVHQPEIQTGIRGSTAATTSNEMQILRSVDFVGIVACGM